MIECSPWRAAVNGMRCRYRWVGMQQADLPGWLATSYVNYQGDNSLTVHNSVTISSLCRECVSLICNNILQVLSRGKSMICATWSVLWTVLVNPGFFFSEMISAFLIYGNQFYHNQGCESICEKKSHKVWNNLKCLKRCAFQCIKSLKMGFCEEQKSMRSD